MLLMEVGGVDMSLDMQNQMFLCGWLSLCLRANIGNEFCHSATVHYTQGHQTTGYETIDLTIDLLYR